MGSYHSSAHVMGQNTIMTFLSPNYRKNRRRSSTPERANFDFRNFGEENSVLLSSCSSSRSSLSSCSSSEPDSEAKSAVGLDTLLLYFLPALIIILCLI